ncbi:MAG: Ig-like domain-containing protein [Gallionella sp.]|nr:Ig-like domain-containing protein [Gallionella sp.]
MLNHFFSKKIGGFSAWFLLAASVTLLAGCGGGGSGTATGTPSGGATAATPSIAVALTDSAGATVTTLQGESPATVKATVKNADGTAVSGTIVTFSTDAALATLSQTTALTDAAGVATVAVTMTTNSPPGAGTINASADVVTTTGTTPVSATGFATYSVGGSFAGAASLSVALTDSAGATVTTLPGGAPTTVKATARDAAGAPVAGIVVSFSTDATKATISPATALTNASGIATVTMIPASSTASGAAVITATSQVDTKVVTGSKGFDVVGSSSGAASLTVTLSSTSVSSSAPVTVTATLKDVFGVAIAGEVVTFSTDDTIAKISPATALTNASGVASASLSPASLTALGAAVITATSKAGTTEVTDTKGFSVAGSSQTGIAASIELLISNTTISSGSSAIVTALVKSASGGAVSGAVVTFSTDATLATMSPASALTNSSGYASITLSPATTTSSGAALITATVQEGTTAITASKGYAVAGSAPTPTTAASLDLSTSSISVKSDGSTSATITVIALNAANAAMPDITVTMRADSGVLGSATVVTDAAGKATVTFTSGANKTNRTATITATAGTASAQIPVLVVGSTVTLESSGTTLSDDGGSPVTLTITAKDAGGNVVPNATVTMTKTGTGNVTLTPASGATNASGQLVVTATGVAGGSGSAHIAASVLGVTATTDLTVSSTAATFAIDQLTLRSPSTSSNPTVIANTPETAMKVDASLQVGDSLVVQVNAPTSTNVTFATTIGLWNGTSSAVTVTSVAGKATATLTSTTAGAANIQVYDTADPTKSDTLIVRMTPVTPYSITIQASPSVVSRSVGTTTGASTLIAMVRDATGAPMGGWPVSFSIINPTGGGETVSPVVVYTASKPTTDLNVGEARTSFISGSSSSGAGGVKIRAAVVGTTVATNTIPSGNDVAVIIGGTAGSVSFGMATALTVDASTANYVLKMSVLVADSNGNPAPLGTVVNLSVWPIAWSTGSGCAVDPDGPATGTFLNEDANENLILDPGEDGVRTYYVGGASAAGGRLDQTLSPPNSAAGTLPGTVTTDENGAAAFELTYPKNSAIWTWARIRARTVVQGTETVGQVIDQLAPLNSDVNPLCILPPSPYVF